MQRINAMIAEDGQVSVEDNETWLRWCGVPQPSSSSSRRPGRKRGGRGRRGEDDRSLGLQVPREVSLLAATASIVDFFTCASGLLLRACSRSVRGTAPAPASSQHLWLRGTGTDLALTGLFSAPLQCGASVLHGGPVSFAPVLRITFAVLVLT